MTLRTIGALASLTLALSGCFGDWVKAKKRPYREDLPAPSSPAPVDEGPPHACLLYQAEIGSLCEALLSGTLQRADCYAEVLRLSGKPAIGRDDDPDVAYDKRERSCRGELASLKSRRAESAGRPVAGGLGPQCTAWADRLRTRCLVPILAPGATVPTHCGAWFMGFQSTLQGRAERREEACTRAHEAAIAGDEAGP